MARFPQSAATSIIIATKFTKIVGLLKVAKFTKVLVTATSMLISALAYGVTFGPLFAVALVGMLFVHEMGHVIALRRKGYPTHAPVFIPFLGAAIFVPDMGDRETEAYIGYGGPLLGSLGAFACMAAWWVTGSLFLLFMAYLGLYINLVNMIPIRPLDGGRIMQVAGPYFKYIGLAALATWTLYLRQPSLIVLWLLVLMEIRFPLWWKPAIAVFLTVAMTVLFVEGYGPLDNAAQQVPWFLSAFDVFVGCLISGLFLFNDISRRRHEQRMEKFEREMRDIEAQARAYNVTLPPWQPPRSPYENTDDRSYPTRSVRVYWTAIYIASVVILWGAMAYLVAQLTKQLPH